MSEQPLHPVRRLGPTAWAVLEDLRARSVDVDDEVVAHVSIRALAAELGLAKATVHRATSRLTRAGLIEARQTRTDAGTFTNGHYVLLPTPRDDDHEPVTSTPPRIVRSGQLTLEI